MANNPIKGLKMAQPERKQKASQEAARYDPPEKGPFKCGNCEYFLNPNGCAIVEGHIEAEGCCILYEQK